jgi:DNA-binding FrmR family transcriptional regulator
MEEIDKRLGRIMGQLRGIQKMVKEDRDSVEILQQVSAVKNAIDSLTKEIVFLKIKETLDPAKAEEIQKTIECAINL